MFALKMQDLTLQDLTLADHAMSDLSKYSCRWLRSAEGTL